MTLSVELETKWCRGCGTRFQTKKKKQGPPKQFCSDRCRKRHWDRENVWRYQDNCPSCGGPKYKVAFRCKDCKRPNNPEGFNGLN